MKLDMMLSPWVKNSSLYTRFSLGGEKHFTISLYTDNIARTQSSFDYRFIEAEHNSWYKEMKSLEKLQNWLDNKLKLEGYKLLSDEEYKRYQLLK